MLGVLLILINRPPVYPSLPQGKWHLEKASVDDNSVHWGRAVQGSYPKKYFDDDIIPAPCAPYLYELRDPFPSLTDFIKRWFPSYTPIKLNVEIPDEPLQVVVKQKLPDDSYATVITNNKESLTLPLLKQAEGNYATPPFILLSCERKYTEYKGMKVEMWNGPSPTFDTEIYKIVPDKP